MTDQTKYTPSYSGIRQMLLSEMIGKALLERAEKVKSRAEDIAPVSQSDKHPGRYRDAFHVRLGKNDRLNRAEAVVWNDSPESLMVEKGTRNNESYNVLVRALEVLRKG